MKKNDMKILNGQRCVVVVTIKEGVQKTQVTTLLSLKAAADADYV